MTGLNYVILVLDLADGTGAPRAGGDALLTPTAQLTGTADDLLIIQAPIQVPFLGGGFPQVKLLATDNGALAPSGWAWTVSFSGVPGNPASFSFFLPYASGATQYLSALAPAQSVVTMQAYMPLPSGTPEAGQVPAATGTGDASAWTTLTAVSVGADASGAAAAAQANAESYAASAASTAQGNAEAFATSAVTAETSRAETAEALLAPKVSPALTGNPTAPTQTAGDSSARIATDAFVAAAVSAGRPYTLLPGWSSVSSEAPLYPPSPNMITGVTGCNFRKALRILSPALNSCRLVFGNFTGEDQPGPNAFTVSANIEQGLSPWTPVFFGGQASVTIPPGGYVISDPIAVQPSLVQGAGNGNWIIARMFVSIASSGLDIPCNYYTGSFYDRIDTTQTNVIATSTFSTVSSHYGFGPIAVLGNSPVSQLVAFVGDSILYGYGDFPTYWGYSTRWAVRDSVQFIKVAMPSETAQNYSNLLYSPVRRTFTDGATVAICEHGVNDGFGPPANITAAQGYMAAIWADLASRGVKRIWQTTITPETTSTDGWATTGNQTLSTTSWTLAQRSALNAWIRSVPSPLTGYIEIADVVETARNSGIWNAPGYTADGVHPSTTAHEAILATLGNLAGY